MRAAVSHEALPSVLHSPLLRDRGVRHAFSTRHGGVSHGPFTSLNLGGSVGDDPARVAENTARFATALGCDPARLYQTSQVHGATVWTPSPHDTPATARAVDADALVARRPGDAVAVRVADCVPVLLASPETGVVAAVHAGWRGVAARIVARALDAMNVPAESVIAAVGPSIGPCCFEVGPEVAAQIGDVGGPGVVLEQPDGRNPHADLWRAVAWQLAESGVREVDVLRRCTRCEPAWFFSFRRDGARSGRMVGAIVAGR